MKRSLFYCLMALLTAQFIVSGCAARLGRMNDNQKAERLAMEKGRVNSLTDPVAKTKSYITISTILLDFSTEAARDGQLQTMKSLLGQYQDAIRSALEAMLKSNRDPERRPSGFKELEITLRQHVRTLDDVSRSLAFEERGAVEEALRTAAVTRERVLRLLFPKGVSLL